MKTFLLVRLSVLAAALVFAACGGNNNQGDAGTQADAGTGDAGIDAGADAGVDGGLTSCTLGTPCPAGQSCLLVEDENQNLDPFCVPGACDLVAQDCPVGQACTYADVMGTTQRQRACSAPGTAQEGEACETTGCVAGLVCVGGPGQTQCLRFCSTNADCGMGMECFQAVEFSGTSERPLVCTETPPTCDPLLQDCPSATDACYLTQTGAACTPAGSIAVGQPCTTGPCVKGATCLGLGDGGSECAVLCGYPNTLPTCTTGQCAQLRTQGGGPVLDGGVGVCR
ncbi:MAG: hypothetical protein WBV82_24085 [Myxococcaceae bacterium]